MKKIILSALVLGATVCALAADDNSANVGVSLTIAPYAAISSSTGSVAFNTSGNPTGQDYLQAVTFSILSNCPWSVAAAVTTPLAVGTLTVVNMAGNTGTAAGSAQNGGFDIKLSGLSLADLADTYTGGVVTITLSGD
jgi:hypothetical protein